MANPAWKKTAEKMTPKGVFDSSKPSSTLTLDWVHGYRGFDCRNNVFYADEFGTQILFTAAALGVVQSKNKNENKNININTNTKKNMNMNPNSKGDKNNKTQNYFGEHTDDIISITMHNGWNKKENQNQNQNQNILIASGEIGKIPAINIYNWNFINQTFESLACVKGFHTVGISQLSFSNNGTRLFSVGVDYTIAIYDVDKLSKSFGKMVCRNHLMSSYYLYVTVSLILT